MTLEHKTSLKCQFCEIEMYASYENWINSFALMYGLDNIWKSGAKKSKYWETHL